MVLAAVVAAVGGVIVAVLDKFRKENSQDHQVVLGMLSTSPSSAQKKRLTGLENASTSTYSSTRRRKGLRVPSDLTRRDLVKLRGFLTRIFTGVGEQEELLHLIGKLDNLIRGEDGKASHAGK
jgi:hypothetical protein